MGTILAGDQTRKMVSHNGTMGHVVQRLQRQERAGYFATTMWSVIEEKNPILADYLRAQERIPVDVRDTALFRLN